MELLMWTQTFYNWEYRYSRHNMQWLLTHWGRMTHICVGNLTIIGSDNGLSSGRRQAIIWTNVRIFLIGPLGTYFNEILIEINIFSFKKMHLKTSSAKRRPFCLGLNVLSYNCYKRQRRCLPFTSDWWTTMVALACCILSLKICWTKWDT